MLCETLSLPEEKAYIPGIFGFIGKAKAPFKSNFHGWKSPHIISIKLVILGGKKHLVWAFFGWENASVLAFWRANSD